MADFDVVDLGPAAHPAVGESAPDFIRPLVTDEFWEDRTLSELVAEGGQTIVVFTPMIGSFVGTYVWEELRDRDWAERADRIVGVTASTPYAVSAFITENDAPFDLFADPANDVADAYGIPHDLDGMAGVSEPRVAFFAIDDDMVITASWVATDWPEFPEYDELEDEFGL
ncbi:alkyl hydroperoxide reductase/ thiol specific antioxidant/ Mal allergen [Natrialba chahannaoensis JCM 10990]|uniref:Alkyl hydroperoxide reductase/ thiol specific antioxidant/ Mal allergen n=1 Tax=Natrialba chahannaoensis JCM 10990 TaxID=1227492 RepID=M0AUN4_9EURY|nr:redoxin domain-containing protein [Natrialba chahannaoensis]ELZ02275.1 alkyl hydroperoxide reductase/ thiol specific antioxidant/ Mal allergen [Natrialba chahannaoensis JCM 10990]